MKYRLSVHGTVEYDESSRDDRTKNLLLAQGKVLKSSVNAIEVAIQELQEEAKDIAVSMAIIEEEDEED